MNMNMMPPCWPYCPRIEPQVHLLHCKAPELPGFGGRQCCVVDGWSGKMRLHFRPAVFSCSWLPPTAITAAQSALAIKRNDEDSFICRSVLMNNLARARVSRLAAANTACWRDRMLSRS
jgi:hypothetical protein